MSDATDDPIETDESSSGKDDSTIQYVPVYENRPENHESTCLRPLGLCELGGCCDACWYNPDHPRHKQGGNA